MRTKKTYQQPETAVTQVELESPICSGSVNYTGDNATGVNINAQNVTTAGENTTNASGFANDFSGSAWGEVANQ